MCYHFFQLVLHHAGLDYLQEVYQQMVIDSSEAPPTYHSGKSRFSPDDVMISLSQIDVPIHCDFSVPVCGFHFTPVCVFHFNSYLLLALTNVNQYKVIIYME